MYQNDLCYILNCDILSILRLISNVLYQPPGKGAKMAQYVNYRMRVTMADARVIIGTFLAYDKYMNIILADSEEFRKVGG